MDLATILENFSLLDEWDDRYRYLIELGRTLEPLEDAAHNDVNKVRGCASQVWLATRVDNPKSGDPVLTFKGDSDAHIVRGLIALLFAIYSGKKSVPDPFYRCAGAIQRAWPLGAFDRAAQQWRPRHGRAHEE